MSQARAAPNVLRTMAFTEFCVKVLRYRQTLGQRVFSKVAFDGVDPCRLDGREREVAREMFGDVDEVPAAARRTVAAYMGRDSGKSTLGSDYVLYRLVTADVSQCGPGDLPLGVVIAPEVATARLMIRKALARVETTPELAPLLAGETSRSFTLRRPDGRLVAFEAIAASRGGVAARGRPIIAAALDEADFFYSDGGDYVRTDSECCKAMTPRLLKGGSILLISTPWADESYTRKQHAQNFGDPQTALVAVASTPLMRDNDPDIMAIIATEMANDEENAQREFFCRLVGLGGTQRLFDPQTVDLAIDPELALPGQAADFDAFGGGWDLALTRDAAVQAIVGSKGNRFALVALTELRPKPKEPLKLSSTVWRFAADARPFPVKTFWADGHAREPAREYTAPLGLTIENAPEGQTGKAVTHLLAKKLFAEGRVRLPFLPRLAAQLRAIVSRQTPGGGLSITSPRRGGSHGDIASAFVLGLFACHQRVEYRYVAPKAYPSTSIRGKLFGY